MTIGQILFVMFITFSGIFISYRLNKIQEIKNNIKINLLLSMINERDKKITELYNIMEEILKKNKKEKKIK